MPTYEFTAPDGKTYEITGPEGSTPEQAFGILQQQLGGQAPAAPEAPARTGAQEAGHRAGIVGRGLAAGVTGLPTLVGDAMTALMKHGPNPGGRWDQENMKYPSDTVQRLLTQAGLPEAETGTERAVEIGASMLGGQGDPLARLLTKHIAPAAGRVLSPQQQALHAGQAAGYRIPPSQAGSGIVGNALESVAGKAPLAESLARKNQTVTNSLSRKAAGLPEDAPLTRETLESAINATYEAGYKPIEQLGRITTGGVYRRDLDKVLTDFMGSSRSFPAAAKTDVRNLVNSYRVREFNSADALSSIAQLRRDATAAYAAQNPTLAKANRAIAKALEDNIELNLRRAGEPAAEMLGNFRAARTQIAKQEQVSKFLEQSTGNVNAMKAAAKHQKSPTHLTDELKTIAEFAKNAGPVARVPSAVSTPTEFGGGMHAAQMLVGTATGGFGTGAALAAMPFGRAGVRAAIGSNLGQRLIGPSTDPNIIAQLARNASVINAMPSMLMQSGLYGDPYLPPRPNQ